MAGNYSHRERVITIHIKGVDVGSIMHQLRHSCGQILVANHVEEGCHAAGAGLKCDICTRLQQCNCASFIPLRGRNLERRHPRAVQKIWRLTAEQNVLDSGEVSFTERFQQLFLEGKLFCKETNANHTDGFEECSAVLLIPAFSSKTKRLLKTDVMVV